MTADEVLDAVRIRNARSYEEKRLEALTIYRALALLTEGGNVLDIVSHLIPRAELERLRAEDMQSRALAEETEKQRRALAYVRAYNRIKATQ